MKSTVCLKVCCESEHNFSVILKIHIAEKFMKNWESDAIRTRKIVYSYFLHQKNIELVN